MRIKISGVVNDSIVDGAGFRLTVFTQGCHHNCPGCHNPQTHDPEGGFWSDTEDILNVAAENPLLDGITLSGGDPMEQPAPCTALAEGAHKMGLNVWTYTGYTWEALLEENNPERMMLLKSTDVLVDETFSYGSAFFGTAVQGQQKPAYYRRKKITENRRNHPLG